MDSNHRPRAYQARALTCWAMSPRIGVRLRCLLRENLFEKTVFSDSFQKLFSIWSKSQVLLCFLEGLPLGFGFSAVTFSCLGSLYPLTSCYAELFCRYHRLEMMGFEPMTPCLQGRCSPNWATPPFVYPLVSLFLRSFLLWMIPYIWDSLKIEQHLLTFVPSLLSIDLRVIVYRSSP